MKSCIVCDNAAQLYCFNDDAYLCVNCDEQVHSANAIAQKHQRVKVCELCCSLPAAVFCKNDNAHLCADCDASSHAGVVMSRHQRVPVGAHVIEGVCCNVERDAISSKAGDQESQAGPECPEEDSMFAVPEVPLVPPGIEDFPEWNAISGPLDAKSLLGKEFEHDLDIFDMDPTWLDRLDMGFDDLTQSMIDGVVPECNEFFKDTFKEDRSPAASNMPSDLEQSLAQNPSATALLREDCRVTMPQYQAPAPVSHAVHHAPMMVPEWMPYCDAEPLDVSSFVPPSMRAVDAQTLLDRAADRKMRLARYREKKKNRQFKKTIRYASRKAYAEVRPRVKGRFARKDEVAAMRAAGMLPVA